MSAVLKCAVAAVAFGLSVSSVLAFTPVYGGLTYDASEFNGYMNQGIFRSQSNLTGSGVGFSYVTPQVDGTSLGLIAQRITPTGAVVLGSLGTDGGNRTNSIPYAVNATGTMAGFSQKYDAGHNDLGLRAVTWAPGSTTPLELQLLSSDQGFGKAVAFNIAANGTVLGFSSQNVVKGQFIPGQDIPVKWDAAGNITPLTTLGYSTGGSFSIYGQTGAQAMNSAGVIVGNLANTSAGSRAIRWESNGAGIELQPLASFEGSAQSTVNAISDAGKSVGTSATGYTDAFTYRSHAVAWNAAGVPTELAAPAGTAAVYESRAQDVNSAGFVVGQQSVTSTSDGRAIVWSPMGTPTLLGTTGSSAAAINEAGLIVGSNEGHAFVWSTAGGVLDLNTLIDPASGWTLATAVGISEDNWVSGFGSFDPDGAGAAEAYNRAFLLQIPEGAVVVPEPAAVGLMVPAVALLMRRRRA